MGNAKIELFEAFLQMFSRDKLTLCNSSDQICFLIHKHVLGPSGVDKPSPFRLEFQHHPRDPADVTAIMFGLSETQFCWEKCAKVTAYTANSEIFVRILFSRNFADGKFFGNNTLAKCRNHSVVY